MNPFESASVLEDARPSTASPARSATRCTQSCAPGAVRDALHGVWLGHPLHPVLVQVPGRGLRVRRRARRAAR